MKLEEVQQDGQVSAREMLPEVSFLFGSGSVRQFGCPIKLSFTPAEYHFAGRPKGSDTKEILTALGYKEKEIELMTY